MKVFVETHGVKRLFELFFSLDENVQSVASKKAFAQLLRVINLFVLGMEISSLEIKKGYLLSANCNISPSFRETKARPFVLPCTFTPERCGYQEIDHKVDEYHLCIC